jgi:hypothetical protein
MCEESVAVDNGDQQLELKIPETASRKRQFVLMHEFQGRAEFEEWFEGSGERSMWTRHKPYYLRYF